jgi:cytochrome P450
MLIEDFGTNVPGIAALFLNYYPSLFISDPDMLNELYVTKNKYFDKNDLIRNLFYPLMGDSILLSDSSEIWGKKRKVLSAAFYKEKLIMMCDLVKQCMNDKIRDLKTRFAKTGLEMNLMQEISKTYVKIIMTCAFGEDLSEHELDYSENGLKTKKTVAFVLRETFHKSLRRWHTP